MRCDLRWMLSISLRFLDDICCVRVVGFFIAQLFSAYRHLLVVSGSVDEMGLAFCASDDLVRTVLYSTVISSTHSSCMQLLFVPLSSVHVSEWKAHCVCDRLPTACLNLTLVGKKCDGAIKIEHERFPIIFDFQYPVQDMVV